MPELPKGVDDYDEEHVYPHCPAFKNIGDLRGPFDLGLIPIGAYVRTLAIPTLHLNGAQTPLLIPEDSGYSNQFLVILCCSNADSSIVIQDPRWIMSPMHANPFDSVNIFKDTKCRRAMGIHVRHFVISFLPL